MGVEVRDRGRMGRKRGSSVAVTAGGVTMSILSSAFLRSSVGPDVRCGLFGTAVA